MTIHFLQGQRPPQSNPGFPRKHVIAVCHFSRDDHLFRNIDFEMDVRNRPEGQRFVLRYVHHF